MPLSNIDTLIDHAKKNNDYNKMFNHFCMIVLSNGKGGPISFGINQVRKGITLHAEKDAINNLPPRKKRRLVKITLIVIRISRRLGHLGDSKCCMHCCECIYKIPPLRGYTVDSVIYSNSDGELEEHHPIELLIEDNYHISSYFSSRNYKPKIRKRVMAHPDVKTKMFLYKKDSSESE